MLDVIPLESLGLAKKWPRLHQLQTELVGLEEHRRRAEEQASTLHNQLPSAKERDLAAAAEAVRAGKEPAAEGIHEREIQERQERARRDAIIYQRAVSAAMSDIGAFRAKHQTELFADVAQRRAEIAKRMGDAARVAASEYARYEGLARLVATLEPVESVEESDEPARSVTHILSFATGQRAPERGDVEAMLAYLAGLGQDGLDRAVERNDEQADDLVDEATERARSPRSFARFVAV